RSLSRMFKITLRVKIITCLLLFLGFTNFLTSENSKGKSSFEILKIALWETNLQGSSKETYQNELTAIISAEPKELPKASLKNSYALEIEVENIVDISCFGLSDGAIEISVSGGSGSYTYLWSGNGRN